MADYEQHGHEQSIQQVHEFTAEAMDSLGDLEPVIPPAAHDALLNAAQVVFALDAAAQNVCPDCGEGLTEVPAQLLAGARRPSATSPTAGRRRAARHRRAGR